MISAEVRAGYRDGATYTIQQGDHKWLTAVFDDQRRIARLQVLARLSSGSGNCPTTCRSQGRCT
jgi:hypothetical protein